MMKKSVRSLSVLLVIAVILSCVGFTGITASAAYVTDGTAFYTAGDVIDNGTIDICDLVAAYIGSGIKVAADLDGDGAVGDYDYALLRAMILGIDDSRWTE